jgi:hypothetical protein
LALALGCNRSQLLIGVQQASQGLEDPAKLGLLWTTELLLNLRTLEQIRDFFEQVLTNSMLIGTLPDYLNGFILALTFAPRISRFVVELLSKLFADVPDTVLLPWLPSLILRLRSIAAASPSHTQILQGLIKEAAASFPNRLSEFALQQPNRKPARESKRENERENQVRQMLFRTPITTEILARSLGVENLIWQADSVSDAPVDSQPHLSQREALVQELIKAQPATINFLQFVLNT